MTATSPPFPGGQPRPVSALPVGPPPLEPPDPGAWIQEFNAEHPQHEDLWTRVLHTVDAVRHGRAAVLGAEAAARDARLAHLALQAEDPDRRAPRRRQLALVASTVALDATACEFAAQALGNGQLETLVWTALFLAVLVGGELALDHYAEQHRGVWRALATGLAGYVAGLGVLRYSYLATVGTGGMAALMGAGLFTAATGLFVLAGYWALRRAETPAAGRARRRARAAAREAGAAHARLGRRLRERDKLADAYVVRVKARVLPRCRGRDLPAMESALRAHLTGEEERS